MDVKTLAHADYRGGQSPLRLITGCQGKHLSNLMKDTLVKGKSLFMPGIQDKLN